MPITSQKGGATLRWIVGTVIAFLAAGAGTVALIDRFHPPPGPCFLKGKVYHSPEDTGLSEVHIEYETKTGQFAELAESGPDGSFDANCSDLTGVTFPVKIRLRRTGWPRAVDIEAPVNRNEEALNFFVDTDLAIPTAMLKRGPINLPLPAKVSPSVSPSPATQGNKLNKNALIHIAPAPH